MSAKTSKTTDLVKRLTQPVPEDEYSWFFATEITGLMHFFRQLLGLKSLYGWCAPEPDFYYPIDLFKELSVVAKAVFFCGGMARFSNMKFQVLYDVIFVSSFAVCMISCIVNYVTVQTAPFYDWGTELVTIYFHLVGLHAWLFWRGFVVQPQVSKFAKSFLQNDERSPLGKSEYISVKSAVGQSGKDVKVTDMESGNASSTGFTGYSNVGSAEMVSMKKSARFIFVFFLLLLLVLTVIGYFAFPIPAYVYGTQGQGTFEYDYTIVHSFIMFAVIPQHIPTMMAVIGLFYLMCALHKADMRRARRFVCDPNQCLVDDKEDFHSSLEASEAMIHSVQDRLNYFSRRAFPIWTHMMLYAGVELAISFVHFRELMTTGGYESISMHKLQVATDLFHGAFGSAWLTCGMVIPASVSNDFREAAFDIWHGMRNRGWGREYSNFLDAKACYLFLKIRGWIVCGETLLPEGVVKFMTLIGIMGTFLMSLSSGGQ